MNKLITALLLLAATTARPAPPPSTADRDALSRGQEAFALALYKRVAGRGGNVVLSPYSIATAMTMVHAGTGGATARELEAALRLPFSGPPLDAAASQLMRDVTGSPTHRRPYELSTANALWAAKGIPLRSDYLARTRQHFAARVEEVDFSKPTAAAARINSWVSEATREKIPAIVDASSLDGRTLLVLTNAVYLKAKWRVPFKKERTFDADFRVTPTQKVKTQMMGMYHYKLPYVHAGGVRVIELAYEGNDLSMLVVLPDAVDGLAAIERKLTPELIASWTKELKPSEVVLDIPRFQSSTSLSLVDDLKALGANLVFDPQGRGDFRAMTTVEDVCISRVVHKARIDVDEAGTEAAAATAVEAVVTSVQLPPPTIFRADHPFLYVIRKKPSGAILFIGRLTNPSS